MSQNTINAKNFRLAHAVQDAVSAGILRLSRRNQESFTTQGIGFGVRKDCPGCGWNHPSKAVFP